MRIGRAFRYFWPIGSKTFKVHIDGYNLLPYLTGEVNESPRKFLFYISDDGDILGVRMRDWKLVLMEQRAHQLACWFEPFVRLRATDQQETFVSHLPIPMDGSCNGLQHLSAMGLDPVQLRTRRNIWPTSVQRLVPVNGSTEVTICYLHQDFSN